MKKYVMRCYLLLEALAIYLVKKGPIIWIFLKIEITYVFYVILKDRLVFNFLGYLYVIYLKCCYLRV